MTAVVERIRGNWRFDTVAAVVGLLLAIAMFPLRFFASQIFVQTIPLVLGGACLLYLVVNLRSEPASTAPVFPSAIARLVPGFVFTTMAVMVAIAVHGQARTPSFFVLAGVVGALLVGQTVLSREADFRPGLVLFELLAFSLVLRLTALYLTPGFVGIDVWTHVTTLSRQILRAHSLAAIDGNKYYASPLYHLLVVTASMAFDVSLRTALYLTVGLVMPVSILTVYSTSTLLVQQRWAVLAAVLYGLGDYVVQWGLHLIPTSLGLAFYLVVLYLLVRITRTAYNPRDYAALFFASVAVILTHQVSTFIMLVTMCGAIVVQAVMSFGLLDRPDTDRYFGVESRDPVNLIGQFVFDVGFVTFMWSLTPYKGNSFLETVLSFLRQTVVSSAGFLNLASESSASAASAAQNGLIQQIVVYVDTGGFLLLLFATFLGCLYVVNRTHTDQSVVTLLVVTAAMLVFVMGLPLFGIRNFIPTRWYAFLYAPMAVLGAIGLRYVTRRLGWRPMLALVVVFAFAYAGTMMLSVNATVDNPVFADEHAELSYNRQELQAADAVDRLTTADTGTVGNAEEVYTDHPYQTLIERREHYPADVAVLNATEPTEHDFTVYRRAQSTEATYFSVRGKGTVMNVRPGRVCRPSQNVLYSNGDVLICHERAA